MVRGGWRGWGTAGLMALSLGLSGGLAGCAHEKGVQVADEAPGGPYRLGREDVIEVSVYRDPDLTRTVPVRPDGRISLPIVGDMEAAGRTVEEVRTEICQKLSSFVKDPTVISVIVREVRSARVYVTGEVVHPGAFPLAAGLTPLQAVALAGGLGEFSARDTLTVLRAKDGKRYVIDLEDLQAGDSRVVLQPGDTVVVR